MDPERFALYEYYVGWFVVLLIALYVFRKVTEKWQKADGSSSNTTVVTEEFRTFQRTYIIVYLTMMAADWLQGPYVYALYQHYGFSQADIGRLFIAGFGSSLIFGTFVGSLADKYGRKRSCILFGITYGLSCMTKHSSEYNTLLFGRVLGGLATSILFSSFESWMVHQHHDASYPEEWLALTFSTATAGNGIVAIGAGVVASIVRDNFGAVAPFDTSLILLAIGTLVIMAKWSENYGDANSDVFSTVATAWDRLWDDQKIALLGMIQSFFEGAMYIFVFMWTPALASTSNSELFHGWIFASFMICVLIGSNIFNLLVRLGLRVERFSVYTFAVSAVSLFVPAFIPQHTIRLMCFFVFEVCVGIFWPSMGFMRSRYVPEEVRATVMNYFRIPLNLIVVLILANIGTLSELQIFALCTLCLVPALFCQLKLLSLTADNVESHVKKFTDTEELIELGDDKDKQSTSTNSN